MKVKAIVVIIAVFACAGFAYGAGSSDDPATETVRTVGSTAQTAVSGTVSVAEMSVTDTAETPMTALTAVKDTASTAFRGADRAIKSITGEE